MNITNIPAPRVDFIDQRTGLMAREWYRFFLNLFVLVGSGTNQTSLTDVQVGPDVQDISQLADEAIQQAQLLALMERYDEAEQLFADRPESQESQDDWFIPQAAQSTNAENYNRVLAWLLMGR